MTASPDSFNQFGQTLAFAERALTAVLRRHLAERQTTPETWYALQLIATRGPALDREALSGRPRGLAQPRRRRDARAAGSARGGWADPRRRPGRPDDRGEAVHRSLREYIAEPRTRLLSQFDVEDVETTIRTLQAITARAEEELAVAG